MIKLTFANEEVRQQWYSGRDIPKDSTLSADSQLTKIEIPTKSEIREIKQPQRIINPVLEEIALVSLALSKLAI
jgi:hypothetical protein